MTGLINRKKLTAKIDLKKFPFLRYKTLSISYNAGSISIDEKLQLLHYHLQLFETALSDLEEITFAAKINQNDQTQFHDHTQFARLFPGTSASNLRFFAFLLVRYQLPIR